MTATRNIFQFKCKQGHLMEKTFALGTRVDDEDETTCAECLTRGIVEPAYVVLIVPTTLKGKS